MPAGPILFLDSGVGGLSVLDAVSAALPAAPLVYCADSAGFPYGTKGEAEVSARVAGLLGRLAEYRYYNIDGIVAHALALAESLAAQG